MSGAVLLSISALIAAAPSPAPEPHYRLSPVTDAAVLVLSFGLAGTLELILSTGELRPQAPGDPAALLGIDRRVATSPEPARSRLLGDLFLGLGLAGAAIDATLSPILDRPDSFWTHLTLYAESAALNIALADITKMAVRRPRPIAYHTVRDTGVPPADTDSSLSFYSLHTALAAGLSATATHLAFHRSPDGVEPWVILGGGALLTALVAWQRVEARAHFPTDVLAGALVGAAIGTLVPELHRVEGSPVTVMAGPSSVGLAGAF